ncbi:MAG: FAD-dependent oxidoreductase [Spirochaetales bacterium]|nr:FAD-dependent oxidoreductase [Spirochaetales bacterium]
MKQTPDLEKKLRNVRRSLHREGLSTVQAVLHEFSVRLSGEVGSWDEKVRAGYAAAGKGFRGVLNDIRVPGVEEPAMSVPLLRDKALEGAAYDVVIVGGGVIGCGIARELSRRDLKIGVLEKEDDAALQASGRNDGMIHPGFAAAPGTLKAAYNSRGNRMYDDWARELDFEIKRTGSILLYRSLWMHLLTPYFKRRCRLNKVDGPCRGLSARQVRELEPYVTEKQKGGFLMPSTAYVSPYRVTLALAENAADNGCDFHFQTALLGVELSSEGSSITHLKTNRGTLSCRVLINAAGVWSDKVAEMAGDRFFSIHGRKGTDAILDKRCEPFQTRASGMPSLLKRNRHSKGGGVVPCVEGNILLGPTAQEVADREDYSTDAHIFGTLVKQLDLNRELHQGQIISYYSGVRAASWEEDFILGPSVKVANLLHAAAIQSPGFASAPAICRDMARWCEDILSEQNVPIRDREGFNPVRRGIPRVREMSEADRDALIRKDPAYGDIVCRCEEISRGEIRDALCSSVPAQSVDGIKRRVRAGAGRCHGGFCLPRIIAIMAREMDIPLTGVTKKGPGSQILMESTKKEAPLCS